MVRRTAERGRSANVRRCDVGRDTLMYMMADGEDVAPVSKIVFHMACPGVVIRPIADETEQARFNAV